jgi:GNAT superfamily N-acetyltransferase
MSLQVANTAQVTGQTPVDPLPVRLDEHPASGWLDVWHAVHGRGGDWRSERDMLRRVEQPSAYACATSESDVIAVGRVVTDHGWAGVFGRAALPQARGKGAARAVLAALAGWAAAHGAGRMYLQVEQGNRPAVRLYGRRGSAKYAATTTAPQGE